MMSDAECERSCYLLPLERESKCPTWELFYQTNCVKYFNNKFKANKNIRFFTKNQSISDPLAHDVTQFVLQS